MLNPFPILFLAPLGYMLLRLTLGLVLILIARRQLTRYEVGTTPFLVVLMITEAIAAGFLFLGLGTQAAALATLGVAAVLFWYRSEPKIAVTDPLIPLLIAGAALTLTITGAGTIAFDLPI